MNWARGFFDKYVQNPADGTDQAGLIADHLPTDSQRHILLNLRLFLDRLDVLTPDAYEVVVNRRYPSREPAAGVIDQLLGWLDRLDNRDWVAPAISHLRRPDVTAGQVARYLADLERLAASMFVRRVDITRRIERYGQVLEAMERGADLHAPGSPLQLSADDRRRTIAGLDADIYNVTRIRLYVLLRLDSALAGAGATYDDSVITVEHVLPRNPAEGSPWRRWFTDEQRAEWTHRLANLVLLARRKNSQAGNFAFAYKQRSYFRMADGVSPFALTSQVLGQTEWTPEVLERRQRALLAKLIELWRL